MDTEWLITILEAHLDFHRVTNDARRGCQYHGEHVLERSAGGWHRTDREPREGGGFIPSGRAIGEVSARAVRELKALHTPRRAPYKRLTLGPPSL